MVYKFIKLLSCTPETNVALCVNYPSIFKNSGKLWNGHEYMTKYTYMHTYIEKNDTVWCDGWDSRECV